MAVFNTKLPLMYLGQKDEAGVVTYERSELPVTLTSQAGRLQVYLDVLYRLGMIPSWDAAAQQLTITLDPVSYTHLDVYKRQLPVGPVGPIGPVAPRSPWGPAGPCGPMGPWGQLGFTGRQPQLLLFPLQPQPPQPPHQKG